ncbi:MAG: chorismate-binding protein, partial [Muribaculaceae bacterium]|nr:chorismate-binding protein [Muribaculaceae bacterium]
MNKEYKAALECAHRNIPFALFAYPHDTAFRFFANPGGIPREGCPYFIVNNWNTPFEESERIYEELDADGVLDSLPTLPPSAQLPSIQAESTSKSSYIDKVTRLIETLKQRGGKTVISRIIAANDVKLDLMCLIERQFASYPDTFRFLYFTPSTGLWMGTSPELLFDFNQTTREFHTMSLAGTRVTDLNSWDGKNIHEQNLVAEFISNLLKKHGASFEMKRCADVQFKPVCHICDLFSGTLPATTCTALLDELSPTPALSGFPVGTAIDEISRIENHSRECYGGYVGYVTPSALKCYVNLRSVKLCDSG